MKKVSVIPLLVALCFLLIGLSVFTLIEPLFGYNPLKYVTLGAYKGLEYQKLEKEINRLKLLGMNSSESGVIRGYVETLLEMPWSKMQKETADIKLAQEILDCTIDATDATSRGVKSGNLLVNRKCMMPSALIELGFMNNPDELENMVNPEYQDKLAAGITRGIISTYNNIQLP